MHSVEMNNFETKFDGNKILPLNGWRLFRAVRVEKYPVHVLAMGTTVVCFALSMVIGFMMIYVLNQAWFIRYGEIQITGYETPAIVILVTSIAVAYPVSHYIFSLLRMVQKIRKELAAAAEEADAANKMKSVFLASTSHEIRTPLNGILGLAQVLQRSCLPPEQAKHVDQLAAASRSLSRLLGDILDISKVEAGRMVVVPSQTDFYAIIEANASLWGATARENGLTFSTKIAEGTPRWLHCDGERVRQCIANLTSNAIKFTSTGSVVVEVSSKKFSGDHVELSVKITDTGPGLTTEDQKRLFAPFVQVGSSEQRSAGTGLGLAISRNLAELMDGDITLRSEPGSGSAFTFTFTGKMVETPHMPAALESNHEDLPSQRLLVADDNDTNCMVARLLLESAEHEVTTVNSGPEAIEALKASSFDALLLDMHMPTVNGPETLRRIRQAKEDWSNTKVIALTADAMSGDRERYLSLGMDGYAVKPIELNQLLAEIARVVSSV